MPTSTLTASGLFWDAGLMGLAVLTIWRTTQAIRRRYRHHRSANKRFMAGYRAGYRAARPR